MGRSTHTSAAPARLNRLTETSQSTTGKNKLAGARRHDAALFHGEVPVARPHGGCLLGVACAVLFVRAVATSSPGLIWAFAAVWVLTLVCLLLLVIRWCRGTAAASARPKGG
ncbi:hypothetical protein [Streptomyces sp. NPDC056401]|uniref:hypothetical protein n=1 Tax=Streptomyces sp. NPDC056401 TaxID=3345809 RepID=UPI0035DEB340